MVNQKVRFRVVIYCPDRHIHYDGKTPYETGVGGGISVRIRMANALQRAGNQVTVIGHLPRDEVIQGVRYLPLNDVDRVDCDVFIGTTSGDGLNLSSLEKLDKNSKLEILWVHGIDRPLGVTGTSQDFIYCVSNFIAGVVRSDWELPDSKLFVSYNPFEERLFQEVEGAGYQKNPWRLIYFSHPSKGLQPALEVLKILRKKDSRFHLEIYGGNQLWGLQEQDIQEQEGVRYSGLIGQVELVRRLMESSFSIQLQERLEPGALAIFEAMRAGCILLASPVGCYPEYIQNGRDGFLVHGSPSDPATHKRTADVIHKLSHNRALSEYVREHAMAIHWREMTVARTWMDHWKWFFDGEDDRAVHPYLRDLGCHFCGGEILGLSDGYHCIRCGCYQRDFASNPVGEEEREDPIVSKFVMG